MHISKPWTNRQSDISGIISHILISSHKPHGKIPYIGTARSTPATRLKTLPILLNLTLIITPITLLRISIITIQDIQPPIPTNLRTSHLLPEPLIAHTGTATAQHIQLRVHILEDEGVVGC